MDSLPGEVLVRLFSYLDTCDLLLLERVSKRVKRLLQESVWDRLTVIDERVIGYPDDNFVDNFVEIAHRVQRVQHFVNAKRLTYAGFRERGERRDDELKNAVLELVGKRTPDAVFPLDVIQDFIHFDVASPSQQASSEESTALQRLVKQFKVHDFSAIRLVELSIYDSQSWSDSFAIWTESERTQLFPKGSEHTRFNIGCFVVAVDGVQLEDLKLPSCYLQRLSAFTCLQEVELESIKLVVPSPETDEFPVISIKFNLRPKSCTLGIDEFKALLATLTEEDATRRYRDVFQLIDRCRDEERVTGGSLNLHNIQAERVGSWLRSAGKEGDPPQNDATEMALARLYPSLVDKLHLYVCYNTAGEEGFLPVVDEIKLLERVREFGVSFTDQHGERWQEGIEWCVLDGARRVRQVLCLVSQNMARLEKLSFDFNMGGQACSPSMFEPIALVTEPLPRLKTLSYDGLPCFPFVVSVVKHAANLRHLSVKSQPFLKEKTGIQWIGTLLSSLEDSKQLRSLDIQVRRDCAIFAGHTRCQQMRESATGQKLVGEIKSQLKHLVCRLSLLDRVSVRLEEYGCCIQLCKQHLARQDSED